MNSLMNRQWLYQRHPIGLVGPEHYELVDNELPHPLGAVQTAGVVGRVHHLLYQRATPQAMLARDYLHRMDEMLKVVGPMVQQGQIHFEETVVQGFERLPEALQSLFTGDHRGKLIVSAQS